MSWLAIGGLMLLAASFGVCPMFWGQFAWQEVVSPITRKTSLSVGMTFRDSQKLSWQAKQIGRACYQYILRIFASVFSVFVQAH
jgi:hypothetical protein